MKTILFINTCVLISLTHETNSKESGLESFDDQSVFADRDFIDYDYEPPLKQSLTASRHDQLNKISSDKYGKETQRRDGNQDSRKLPDKHLTPKEIKFIKQKQQRAKAENDNKIAEIISFLHTKPVSTNYVHDLIMKEKNRKGPGKDNLSLLLEYLQEPSVKKLKAKVLECYIAARKKYLPVLNQKDIWKNRITNNLIIDPFADS